MYLIKSSILLGAILGAAIGVLTLIPIVDALLFFSINFIIGALIIIYLKQKNLVGILTNQDGIIIGASSGFFGFIAAAIVYLPIKCLLNLIFSPAGKYGINLTNSFIAMGYGILVLIMIIVFMALLSALFNAFSALITVNVYEQLEKHTFNDSDKFNID